MLLNFVALRASLSVGFAFFFSAVAAAKFVKVFKSVHELNKHLEESSGRKNLFKIEGSLEAASCLMSWRTPSQEPCGLALLEKREEEATTNKPV